MKSTTYGSKAGAVQRPDDDIVETILVERPIGRSYGQEVLDVGMCRAVGYAARWVYLYYALTGNYGPEKRSLRAAAKEFGMPRETFRRAKEELTSAHILLEVRTYGGPARLIVRDIRDILDPTQNESPPDSKWVATQNGSAPVSRNDTSDTLSSSFFSSKILDGSLTLPKDKDTKKGQYEGTSEEDKSSSPVPVMGHTGGHEANDFDAAFPDPQPKVSGTTSSRKFKLKPPRGPSDPPPSARVRKRALLPGVTIPGWAFPQMYALCYGMETATQRRALTNLQSRRVSGALSALVNSGADLAKLEQFTVWWKSWAKYAPTPEQVQAQWWKAMSEVEALLSQPVKLEDGSDPVFLERVTKRNEEWTDERIREQARRRAKELGNKSYA